MFACAAAPESMMATILAELRAITTSNASISRQNEELSRRHAESTSALLLRVASLERFMSSALSQHCVTSMSEVDQAYTMSHADCAGDGRHLLLGASNGFPLAPASDVRNGDGSLHVRFPGISPAPPSEHVRSAPAVCGDAIEWACPACGSPLCDRASFKSHIYKLRNSGKRRRPQCRMQQRNLRHQSMVSSYPGEFDDQRDTFLSEFYDVVRSACSRSNSEQQAHVQVWNWLKQTLPSGVPLVPDRTADPYASTQFGTSRSASDSSSAPSSSQSSGSQHPSPHLAYAYQPPTSFHMVGEAPGSQSGFHA
jgi:hypothetical protein